MFLLFIYDMNCISLRVSSLCGEQCMSIAVGSVWWRSHWTMKGVVSEGSLCMYGDTRVGAEDVVHVTYRISLIRPCTQIQRALEYKTTTAS